MAEFTVDDLIKAMKESIDYEMQKKPLQGPVYSDSQIEFLKKNGIDPTYTAFDEPESSAE